MSRHGYCHACVISEAKSLLNSAPAPYPGKVFSIRTEQPPPTGWRHVAPTLIFGTAWITLIVLKLTGVITWSWWVFFALASPMWGVGMLIVLTWLATLTGDLLRKIRRQRSST